MTNLPQSFNKLLELYVLTTANQVIDLATPEQQAKLIRLILDIPTDTPSVAIQQTPGTDLPEKTSQPLCNQPSNRLVHNRWLAQLLNRQIERNDVSIARIEQAIESTQQRFQLRVNGFLSETAQASLETWHSHMIKQYQKYLATLQIIQRNNLDQLSRLATT